MTTRIYMMNNTMISQYFSFMKLNINNREISFNTILDGNPSTFIHFKNKKYQIICVALDSSNLQEVIVYKSMYDEKIYTREINEFFSKVDKEKYPNVKQIYRFELEE